MPRSAPDRRKARQRSMANPQCRAAGLRGKNQSLLIETDRNVDLALEHVAARAKSKPVRQTSNSQAV